MRRRLVIAIVSVVAGALVVAGVGTLVLERHAAASAAREGIMRQAQALADEADFATQPRVLIGIRVAARLAGARTIPLGPTGRLLGPLPHGVTRAELQGSALLSGQVVSGTRGDLAYAAVRLIPPPSAGGQAGQSDARPVVLIITRRYSGRPEGAWYLAAALAATLALAALIATWLSRRITRPLEDAVAGTRRIAAGDLSAQVPVAPDSYPELASLTRSINGLAAGLARSRGLERQFLLSVSHDLRTPLTSIRGFSEAIADGTATDTARAAIVIATESRRLERLVRDLLELARLDARQFSLAVRACEVGEIVADTAEGFRPLADGSGLDLTVTISDRPGALGATGGGGSPDPGRPSGAGSGLWVEADPDRLAQVLANLVENAYKFARRGVLVQVGQEGGLVTISVTDDGPGIPGEDLPIVFERLYQSARTPARQAGSGLGLAIVAELAGAMGASVRARSPVTAEGGTQMVVTLPATTAHPRSWPRPAILPAAKGGDTEGR